MPKNLIAFPALFLLIAIFPLTIFLSQQKQEIQQHAAGGSQLFSSITYHVSGKKILDNTGQVFIPYGVQLDGILMAEPNWRYNNAVPFLLAQGQIPAAHDFWHSNTVTLQLGSKALFAQSPYDAEYLATVDQAVTWANQLGMNIILVLQYQGAGNSGQTMPTQDSVNFWNVLSIHYAGNSHVFFDIFNEPEIYAILGHYDDAKAWNFWHNGGTVNGTTYIGMQQLVKSIRSNGFQNLLFVDSLLYGDDIVLLPQHTLTGSNIVYAIHPYLDPGYRHTPAQWDYWWGNAVTAGNFPVVANEWNQYQDQYDFMQRPCLTDAPTVVPQFLSYMHRKNVGIIGFALFPGTLIHGENFTNPTTFDYNPETCPTVPFPDYSTTAQGAGALIVQYFSQYSIQYPVPPLSPTPTPSTSPTTSPTVTPTP